MPSPTNKKQVQSFLGMISYLAKFSSRLSELAELIRELMKDKLPINSGPEHQAAFIHMKKEIASAPVLGYYNPKKQTTLQRVPASKVLVLVHYKIQNQFTVQTRLSQMSRKAMLQLIWNLLQWLGQWRSSIIFFVPVIYCLKQTRNH